MIKYCYSLISFLLIVVKLDAQKRLDKNNNEAYLFVYFTGNKLQDESIHFAVSKDAMHFYALNNNQPVIDSKTISSTGGVRDPHIIKIGTTFYMVATDMVSAKGWNSNRAMILLKSKDLIKWKSTIINIQHHFPGNDSLLRVWAPQTIYDSAAKKIMVYWSMKHGSGPDKIYYAYVNKRFSKLLHAPKLLFKPADGLSCIDADIVQKDSVYHLFYKTEGHGNGIKVATSSSLTACNWQEYDRYVQPSKEQVEGACVFKKIKSDDYILMYDVYTKGKYQFTKSTDLRSFKVIDEQITMDFHPRHGTIMPISNANLQQLFAKWGRLANF